MAGGIIGPAYGVAVVLEPRAVAGTDLGSSCSAGSIGGEWPKALCWVPETGQSPLSSGLVGGVWLRDKRPPPVRHHR